MFLPDVDGAGEANELLVLININRTEYKLQYEWMMQQLIINFKHKLTEDLLEHSSASMVCVSASPSVPSPITWKSGLLGN